MKQRRDARVVAVRVMGNEASSENERRVRQHMVSYRQLLRDIRQLNAIWSASTPPAHHYETVWERGRVQSLTRT